MKFNKILNKKNFWIILIILLILVILSSIFLYNKNDDNKMIERYHDLNNEHNKYIIGKPGQSCSDACDLPGGNGCNRTKQLELTERYTDGEETIEHVFNKAGILCENSGNLTKHCKPNNCQAWGAPYIHKDPYNTCQVGNVAASCDQRPADRNHQRICACNTNAP
jgi:hypothetical protein